ncbi:MAG: hypothetical protein UW44_C0011G0030, partial [Candidatus Collierbacteria bacterium GW2011_GWB2_44_22]
RDICVSRTKESDVGAKPVTVLARRVPNESEGIPSGSTKPYFAVSISWKYASFLARLNTDG